MPFQLIKGFLLNSKGQLPPNNTYGCIGYSKIMSVFLKMLAVKSITTGYRSVESSDKIGIKGMTN